MLTDFNKPSQTGRQSTSVQQNGFLAFKANCPENFPTNQKIYVIIIIGIWIALPAIFGAVVGIQAKKYVVYYIISQSESAAERKYEK